MRMKLQRQVAVCSTLAVFALADPISPLQYSDALDFSAIQKRQDQCPADYFSCDDQGAVFAGTCCQDGQVCGLDAHSSAACCPTSATCTGVAPTATQTASYVSNSYFQFPYIPTSFANGAACTSALSQCSRNYAACVDGLTGDTGGGYGVTIVVPGGGGTTVAPSQTTFPQATATSICSSLSSEGCFDLRSGDCAQAGTTSGFIVGDQTGGAARPTGACMAGVIAGVGLGLMGGQL
ncbi:hypothetical protein F4778DRAFT_420956 [Xylariomycetidae sp. FL2044]|nr:hypothetical protein F4778DRAFT_420956 [Xylariomycetidae sp. FL2044]